MADFRERIEEIKGLLSSQNRALAYIKLLHLQETSDVQSSAADSCHAILPSIVVDISDSDEEIAAQALKCLGFMIYHPAIVASIGGDDAHVIIQSLVRVITTTKIKSVCNLGVWCISVQQFSSSLLNQHFQPLLKAVNYALDNPIGSLSITFEAIQAVVKLASSLPEQMRNMSSLWAPPIYRRLVSVNKKDRDMSERCLLKIMPLICPTSITLSKALALDMKKKLLVAVKELLDQGMKIQCLQAWGWFIRLLGPYATKNKHLLNEMLKILEQTFSDFDSQVQIASLVAWEGLIDALIKPGFEAGLTNPNLKTSESIDNQTNADKYSKIIKLIMAPIIGIMSSRCDASVRASCLSTWSYLLHKLEASASCQSVIETVWKPITEVVFRIGPDNKNIWCWNFCLDLISTLITGGNQGTAGNPYDKEPHQLSVNAASRHYPVNCSSWNLSQLDFFINMISIIVNQNSNPNATLEFRRLTSDAALRLFGSLLGTVQKALRCVSISRDEVTRCLSTLFGFMERICVTSGDDTDYYCPHTCLQFLKVFTEKLEPSILESPLYKVGLGIKCSKLLERAVEIKCPTVPHICFNNFEDKVLPVVCVGTLYFYVIVNSSSETPEYDFLLQQMEGYLKLLRTPQEVFRVSISLLYKNTMSNSLRIWVVLANCLKNFLDSKKNGLVVKIGTDGISYANILHLLSYPFASWSLYPVELELQIVIEVWTSLYASVNQDSESVHCTANSFSVDLCGLLNGCIDHIALGVGTRTERQLEEEKNCGEFSLLCGHVIVCVLKQLTRSIGIKGMQCVDCDCRKIDVVNSVVLAAWFMKLLYRASKEKTDPSHLSVASRFLSELVNFVRCLHRKEDVLKFVETTSSPLLDWLSEIHLVDENTNDQLQQLWTEMLKRLQQSEPSIKFDSLFLRVQEPLLERALHHPNRAICAATINFWNSTYSTQNNLEVPKNLVLALDKLSRNGRLKTHRMNHQREESRSGMGSYKVTNTLGKCSKRVEITSKPLNGEEFHQLHLGGKRKQTELTEHQKDVRRAQQGRARDCSRHGPGIRTYTAVDSSAGNEESQDSPDIGI